MTALDAAAFAPLMGAVLPAPPQHLAIAVSGGADSMALALLSQAWAAPRGIRLTALTVNHRLRPEATAEAEQVATWLAAHGIAHHTLTWAHDRAPAANKQAAARDARYALIEEWCAEHNVAHLLLGHHLDDQAETFLMRLQRGSGVDGLSAMRPVDRRNGLTLLRPLLDTPKAHLQAFLRQQNQAWVEDPSNDDRAYTRTRMRELLTQADLAPATLAATAQHMARARDYLSRQTHAAMETCVIWHEEGYITLDYPCFAALHEEIGLRVLAEIFSQMNGAAYRPRFAELKGVYDALPEARTLAGCQFAAHGEHIRITREASSVAAPCPVTGHSTQPWDGRFTITTSAACPAATIAALGSNGWAQVKAAAPQLAKACTLPKTVIHTLPCLWQLEKPLLVPHIHYADSAASTDWLTARAFCRRKPC